MSEREDDAFDSSPYAGAVVVELVGEIDMASAARARAAVGRVTARAQSDQVVIDLAAVTFMDCSGLNVLVEARNALGDRLLLRRPSRAVARLLDLTDLRETFAIDAESD